MTQIDTYRNTLQRKRRELLKLSDDKAKSQKKLSDYTNKIRKARESMRRSKIQSTINTKMREITRYEKSVVQEGDKLAKLEAKIVAKNKEVEKAQKKVDEEEKRIDKKRQAESRRQSQRQEQRFSEVNYVLSDHARLHADTKITLERLQKLPEEITVAFFASNPLDQDSLRLDEEVRSIQEMLRKSQHRDSVKLKSFWAVRPMDILQALNECNPAIIHFSGHGSSRDELVFQDNSGGTKLVTKEAIVQTMMASAEGIQLVFFNTCYSRKQAELVVQHVEAAIGMSASISDDAARIFSSQFYSAIGFGLSVAKAFEQAKAALMLEGICEEDTPELFSQNGSNLDNLVIVRPENLG